MSTGNTWFSAWFDSPYYHLLYKDRDDKEARFFMTELIKKLQPTKEAHLLDLACGRGRHAKFLHKQGLKVTGIDLSPQNIAWATKHHAKEGLDFEVGDMRQPYGENRFDYILNMFTSFGYFETYEEDIQALRMMKRALKPGGCLVLDFMNVEKVRLGLVKEEVRQVGDIEFHLNRFIRNGKVIKTIRFEDQGENWEYEEQVQLIGHQEFVQMFKEAGLHIEATYGDFDLSPFDAVNSERLVLFAR